MSVTAAPAPWAHGRPETARFAGLSLDRAEALRYAGHAGQRMDGGLRARFDELADACERTLRPAGVWAVFPVAGGGGISAPEAGRPDARVELAGCGLALPGADISRHLEGAREVALMACTLGAQSERELRKHAALGPVDALLYGAAASALVEAAADAMEALIAQRAAACGLRTGFRYSPGYGDLPLSVQPALADALDAARRIGLAVTEAHVLVPAKSVTAVIGLFDADAPAPQARNACETCQLRERCPLRERGTTCHGS